MADTKENILHTALRLFARDGYEAVSVSVIAGKLGMTKGALYKHYKNKRDIFDNIVERIYQIDVERAKVYEVPEEIFDKSPSAYRNTAVDKIKVFIEAQFRFWTEDEFSSNFRKMLTLEQYRNPEIMELYQKCLVSGPVSYMEDLFREMMEQGIWNQTNPKQLALEFYAPFYLLVSISDSMPDKKEAAKLLAAHIERFIEKNSAPRKQKA
ncbi:TetR/AcrR family transcriptional regulator|uniref:Transcriptional regulator, TetR family n=1 Tax=Dendrosporobacter quercicolus TaxID=146817 RepID=A0A1G9NQB9_9FIRM|nr:TetR/AcrR family transcriptional regulator [Dendrosporobacter quercicolus]NSL47422.1 TetR/AcrR family transcriptional regulator [Dendrosporobacter quercicolus DSM 1736]SDL88776.1 transcriptional regulator, TetR family [Dendrosporobacter quercicolus]